MKARVLRGWFGVRRGRVMLDVQGVQEVELHPSLVQGVGLSHPTTIPVPDDFARQMAFVRALPEGMDGVL